MNRYIVEVATTRGSIEATVSGLRRARVLYKDALKQKNGCTYAHVMHLANSRCVLGYGSNFQRGPGIAGYGSIPCPRPIQEEWDTEIPF